MLFSRNLRHKLPVARREAPARGAGMTEDEILTFRDVDDYPKLTERTLYRLTQEGKLPRFKVGSSWRFRLRHIHAWIEEWKAAARREEGRQ
jgi:excisionase family DNA binding protein